MVSNTSTLLLFLEDMVRSLRQTSNFEECAQQLLENWDIAAKHEATRDVSSSGNMQDDGGGRTSYDIMNIFSLY
jgi:hypothetical protein